MAFKTRETKTRFVKATEIEVGDEFVAYFVGYEKSNKFDKYNLVFKDKESGEKIVMAVAGNLNYTRKDNVLEPGLLTKIVRKPDYEGKDGKTRRFFERLQDEKDSIKVAALGFPTDTSNDEVKRAQENIDKMSLANNAG